MPSKKQKDPKNTTEKNLKSLPFQSATDLKREKNEIRMMVWRRFEEARIIDEMSKREEFSFWNERFRKGLVCSYGAKANEIVKVYSDDFGPVQISINEKNLKEIPKEELIGTLVKALTSSFSDTYSKAFAIFPYKDDHVEIIER